ncbi:MAG: RES family NAD+ phosphorylase [Acidobacteriaceae bacterium]
MVLWRISRHSDLSGAGGLRAPGRWHEAGQPIIYLASTPASALLEVCVHTAANDAPPEFTLLRIEGPDVAFPSVNIAGLPPDWPMKLEASRSLGTAWLRAGETLLLQVPSAIVPQTENFLFNPLHPDASKFRVAEALSYPFDTRIKM